jgi:hypothetical protein
MTLRLWRSHFILSRNDEGLIPRCDQPRRLSPWRDRHPERATRPMDPLYVFVQAGANFNRDE